MPLIHITGSPIDIECTVPFSGEFPDMLTGLSEEDQILYFDATAYLEKKGDPNFSVDRFFFNFNYMHLNISKSFELDTKKTVRVNRKDNHILIDAAFALLFIFYVEPDLIAYFYQKLLDLLQNGLAFSDSFVASLAKSQLSDEVLKSLIGNVDGDAGETAEEPTESQASPDV